MMPNRENDPQCSKKKRHIGNDFVAIVYNNAADGSSYKLGTVKGQFINACVVITPLDQGSNRVEIICKPELNEPLGHVKVSYVFSLYQILLYIFYTKRAEQDEVFSRNLTKMNCFYRSLKPCQIEI